MEGFLTLRWFLEGVGMNGILTFVHRSPFGAQK